MTPHFTLEEFVRSNRAKQLKIDNSLPQELFPAAQFTLEKMEEIRKILKKPIIISSGYRSKALNEAVRGAVKRMSQHTRAQAVDFTCPGYGPPASVALYLKDFVFKIGIDQLIYEQTWVHVSFTTEPRHEVLTTRGDGRYMFGIVL